MDYTRHFNKVIILSTALFVTSASLTFAWTEPTLTPPSGNVSAPINTGSTEQTKSGVLNISGASHGQVFKAGYSSFTAGLGISAGGAGYAAGLWNNNTLQATFINRGVALGSYAAANNPPADTLIVNNIGVGTTTPAQTLSVAGTIYSGSGGFRFPDGTTQTTASGGSSQWTTSGSNIYYNTGSVGIGTTSPYTKLAVVDGAGEMRFQNVSQSNLTVTGTNASVIIDSNAGSVYPGFIVKKGGIYMGSVDASDVSGIRLNNASGQGITVLGSNGNVGIGITAPNALTHIYAGASTVGTPISGTNLNIESNTSNYLSLLGPEAAIQGFVIGIPGQNTDTWIRRRGDQTNNPLEFGVGASARMAILDNGDVGIGTSAPGNSAVTGLGFSYSAALHIAGSARPSPTFSGTGIDFRFIDTNASANVKAGDIVYDDQIFKFRGLTDAGAAKNDPTLAIDVNNGRVGIGIAAPLSKLQIDLATGVAGTVDEYADMPAASRVTLSSASAVNDKIGLGAAFASAGESIPAGFVFGREGSSWGTFVAIHTHPNDSVDIDAYPERIRVNSDGNVGIGSSAPGSKLDITNSADEMMRFTRTGATYPTILREGTDGVLVMNNNNVDTLTLKTGSVGVGTTSPSQALSVNGTIYSGTGGFKFPDGTTQTTAGGGGSTAVPTRQILTSGTSATYTTPANVRQLRIRMSGGGGGGGGFNASSGDATAGSTGGTTSFNSITAVGGSGGGSNTVNQARGGAGGTGGTGSASFRMAGNGGVKGANSGGSGAFGGGVGIAGTGTSSTVQNSAANSGSGGTGGAWDGNANPTGGGGAGEYVEIIINNPAASYTYTIGAGGAGGSQGTVGTSSPGGNGGSGVIIVEEIY